MLHLFELASKSPLQPVRRRTLPIEKRRAQRVNFKTLRQHSQLTEYYDQGHLDRLHLRPGDQSSGGGSSGVPGGSLAKRPSLRPYSSYDHSITAPYYQRGGYKEGNADQAHVDLPLRRRAQLDPTLGLPLANDPARLCS